MPESLAEAIHAFHRHLVDLRHASDHTLRAYDRELARFLAWARSQNANAVVDLRTLDGALLRGFAAHLAGTGLAPASLARAQAALRSFGRFLASTERLDHNPASLVRPPPGSQAAALSGNRRHRCAAGRTGCLDPGRLPRPGPPGDALFHRCAGGRTGGPR